MNISVYTISNINDNFYSHFANIWKDDTIKNIVLFHFQNGYHFNLLEVKNSKFSPKSGNPKEIKSKKLTYEITGNKVLKDLAHNNKYVKIHDNYNYYNDIFDYLYSKKINTNKNNQINEKKTVKDEKRQNYRIIAEKHILDKDNILYHKIINKEKKLNYIKFPMKVKLKLYWKNIMIIMDIWHQEDYMKK